MIRTIEQARKEDFMTYYKDTCEFCKKELVISLEDLHTEFYGHPEVADDEYVYKCPECGHVNIGKNKDLEPCYQNGRNNKVFELTDNESQEASEFVKKHNHQDEFKKERKLAYTTLGMQFTYEITPGGLGNCVVIKCNKCGETKDITDSDNW